MDYYKRKEKILNIIRTNTALLPDKKKFLNEIYAQSEHYGFESKAVNKILKNHYHFKKIYDLVKDDLEE